jgi:GTPase-associated protein 1, N-terminal domain type 2
MPQVETHLLASRDGYTTFAKSPSVTPTEQRELEELVYGQPDDAVVYAALTAQATAMLRRLRSTGRYALSRIIQGDRDSAGRDTIAVCTIILTAEQYQAIARGDLWRFLHSPQLWAVTLFRSGQPLALPEMLPVRRAITSSDVTLFDTWMAARSRQNGVAMIGANPASHQAVIALPQVLAEKDLLELTWGCRLFSLPSSISVASIAQRGVEQNSRRIIVTPATSPTTTYGQRSLALVGTNGYLTSVIEPVTTVAKAPPYSAETFSPEEDAPIRAPIRQSGKRSTYTARTGGESKSDSDEDPINKRNVLFLFAGILALCVVVSPFWLVPQFLSSREVTAQKIFAQNAAKDAKSNKDKAVLATTPEDSKPFAEAAEKAAVDSKAAADAAKKAKDDAGFFAGPVDAKAAEAAANSAREDADEAKKAMDKKFAVKAEKEAAVAEAKKAADDAKAEAEAKKSAADAAKAVADAEAKKAEADAAKAAAERALTPTATDPPAATKSDLIWDTDEHIIQLKEGLQELSKCKSAEVQLTLDKLRNLVEGINQYDKAQIEDKAFIGKSDKQQPYNRLLFIVHCTIEVWRSYGNVPNDEMTKAWESLKTVDVDNHRPNPDVINFINTSSKNAKIIDSAMDRMPSTDDSVLNEPEWLKLLSSDKRVTTLEFKGNTLSESGIWLTGPIKLENLQKFQTTFHGLPSSSLLLIFRDAFAKWIDKRKAWVRKQSEYNQTKDRVAFPWEKIYTPFDKDIAALDFCPIPQVASLAKSAQELIKLCDDAAKTGRNSTPN